MSSSASTRVNHREFARFYARELVKIYLIEQRFSDANFRVIVDLMRKYDPNTAKQLVILYSFGKYAKIVEKLKDYFKL